MSSVSAWIRKRLDSTGEASDNGNAISDMEEAVQDQEFTRRVKGRIEASQVCEVYHQRSRTSSISTPEPPIMEEEDDEEEEAEYEGRDVVDQRRHSSTISAGMVKAHLHKAVRIISGASSPTDGGTDNSWSQLRNTFKIRRTRHISLDTEEDVYPAPQASKYRDCTANFCPPANNRYSGHEAFNGYIPSQKAKSPGPPVPHPSPAAWNSNAGTSNGSTRTPEPIPEEDTPQKLRKTSRGFSIFFNKSKEEPSPPPQKQPPPPPPPNPPPLRTPYASRRRRHYSENAKYPGLSKKTSPSPKGRL